MIFTITDFGTEGPYLGQMHAVLKTVAPHIPIINLLSDAPPCDPVHSAYLVAAYTQQATAGDVVLGVVDPGVGSARAGILLRVDGVWFIGPDNGLFEIVARRTAEAHWWPLPRPENLLSATFHGRDWFSPYAGRLAVGQWRPSGTPQSVPPSGGHKLADVCAEVVYIDHYGNLLTGLTGSSLQPEQILELGGQQLRMARTFSEVPEGGLFWYVNANGLVEIAANQHRACAQLGAYIGMPVTMRC